MTTKAHTAAVAYWTRQRDMYQRQLTAHHERNMYADRRHNMDHYRQRQYMRNKITQANNELLKLCNH